MYNFSILMFIIVYQFFNILYLIVNYPYTDIVVTKAVTTIEKSGCLSHFSAFLTFSTNQGVRGSSTFQRTIKANTHLGVGFFVCYDEGREPERVLPEKQSAHTAAAWAQPCLLVVFPSSASLYPPPAAVSSLTLPAHHKNRHPKDVGFLFLYPSNIAKSPEIADFRAFAGVSSY